MSTSARALYPADADVPAAIDELAASVTADGGCVLGIYQEPVGQAWHLFTLLPLAQVHPTPYQRDLSPTHAKRLREVIKKLDRFIDPIVVVRNGPREYWTPNGNHRRDALEKLKAKYVPAIVIAEPEVAFQILALNTEKAHNLKEKSLEVIRMVRGLRASAPERREDEYAFQFEEAYYITLGLLYEKYPRFSGSVYAPVLRRVDTFLKARLDDAYEQRLERATAVEQADALLTQVVARLKKRGITHPYVKNFVMARVNPLTRARKTVPSFAQAWEKIQTGLEKFDAEKVRGEDIARVAVMASAA